VLTGEVSVERHISGMVQELVRMREGEFFGLASSLNDEPYLADLRATRDTTLLLLPSEEFRRVTRLKPEVAKAVEHTIMSRRKLNEAFMSGITAYAELGVAKFDQ
jgi:CRP-like cAMP-binding protein